MELTLKRLLEQAKFTTTRKGYDQDEVDDFLDRAVAMATKVEARLTQALADADKGGSASSDAVAAPTRSDEEIQAEIAAEVEKRVQARLVEIEAAAPQRPAVDDTVTAEEAARTLVLAQRTADAAVAEANQEAEQIRTRAREEAEAQRRSAAEQTEQERSEARGRLAREIHSLEDARDGLRADVSTLEGHVEEQRLQLQSTVAELQRLLEDPAAFRLAPAPKTRDVEVPPLDDDPPAPASTEAAPTTAAGGAPSADASGPGSEGGAVGAVAVEGGAAQPAAATATAPTEATEATASDPRAVAADPEASLDAGPPTAPVSVVDLDLGSPADPIAVASAGTDHAGAGTDHASDVPVDGDDPFLAELRKAMADEEPLGPRDIGPAAGQQGFLDEERRGWRFGKRR